MKLLNYLITLTLLCIGLNAQKFAYDGYILGL